MYYVYNESAISMSILLIINLMNIKKIYNKKGCMEDWYYINLFCNFGSIKIIVKNVSYKSI